MNRADRRYYAKDKFVPINEHPNKTLMDADRVLRASCAQSEIQTIRAHAAGVQTTRGNLTAQRNPQHRNPQGGSPEDTKQITKGSLAGSLSDDVLSMIFEVYVASWERVYPLDWFKLLWYLRTIMLVSGHWMRVALSTPKLWRNFNGVHSKLRKYYSMGLQRSRGVPLNVSSDSCESALRFLRPIGGAGHVRLERLHLQRMTFDRRLLELLTRACTNMHSLSLVNIDGLESEDFVLLLRPCDAVRTMHIHNTVLGEPVGMRKDRATASFPNLQSLYVEEAYKADVEQVLAALAAPNLVLVSIILSSEWPRSPGFFSCRSGILRGVRLLELGGSMDLLDIVGILHHTPRVQVLRLRRQIHPGRNFDRILEYMQQPPHRDIEGNATLVPLLETLIFHVFPVSCEALHKFLDARRAAGAIPVAALGFSRVAAFSSEELTSLAAKVRVFEWRRQNERVNDLFDFLED